MLTILSQGALVTIKSATVLALVKHGDRKDYPHPAAHVVTPVE
jgi:hypothetical protein